MVPACDASAVGAHASLRACMAACVHVRQRNREHVAENLHMIQRMRHGEGRLTDHRPGVHDAAWLVCFRELLNRGTVCFARASWATLTRL